MYILQSDILYINQLFKNTNMRERYLGDIFYGFFLILIAVHIGSMLLLR